MTDAILGASGLWLGSRKGARGTATLSESFFGRSPWLHGQQDGLLAESCSPVLSLFPSFSLPDDPTDLIWRKGIPFAAMTGRTAPLSDVLLAEVFWSFPRL